MVNWLGMTAAISMFSMMNPIIWLWAVFLSRWTDHLGRPLELGFINALTLGGVLVIGQNVLRLKSFDWFQIAVGSIFAGVIVHFAVYLVSSAYRKRKTLTSGVLTAANVVADSASSQLDRIKPFSPDKYDEASYEKAMAEIDSGQLKKSTWAKSLAVSKGDAAKAQANYIVLRVKELQES